MYLKFVVKHNTKEIYSTDAGLLRIRKNMTKSPMDVCIVLQGNWYRLQCEEKCFFFLFKWERNRKKAVTIVIPVSHLFRIVWFHNFQFLFKIPTCHGNSVKFVCLSYLNHRQWFKAGDILKKINGSDVNSVILDACHFFFCFFILMRQLKWAFTAWICTMLYTIHNQREITHPQHTECNTFRWLLSFIRTLVRFLIVVVRTVWLCHRVPFSFVGQWWPLFFDCLPLIGICSLFSSYFRST